MKVTENINKITLRRFDADCYVRTPAIRQIAKEILWFEAYQKKLFATVVIHTEVQDFGNVILTLIPIDPNVFNEISHMFFDKERESLYGMIHPYHVFESITIVGNSKTDKNA